MIIHISESSANRAERKKKKKEQRKKESHQIECMPNQKSDYGYKNLSSMPKLYN